MPLPKFLNHDAGVARTEYTGVTDESDLVSKVNSAAAGFTNSSGVLSSDASDVDRDDVNKASERIIIKADATAKTLGVAQRGTGGALDGLTGTVDISNINYPCDMVVATDSTTAVSSVTLATPRHQWMMNASAATMPDTGTTGGLTLTPLTTAGTLTTGIMNDAIVCDGTDYETAVAAPSYFSGFNEFTVAGWFKPTSDAGGGVAFSVWGTVDKSWMLQWVGAGGGEGYWWFRSSSSGTLGTSVWTSANYPINEWQFIVLQYDLAPTPRRFKIYRNNVAMITNYFVDMFANTSNPFRIGAAFPGQVDRVTFYDSVIGAATQTSLWSLGAPPVESEDQTIQPTTTVTGTTKSSFLQFTTDDSVNTRTFYAGLANRERAQDNLEMTGTLSPGSNVTVAVTLPQDSDSNYFLPDIYNPTKANFKPKVQLRSATTSDSEVAEISDVPALDTGAGTATIEFTTVAGTYGSSSLIGINPQPLIVLSEDSGQAIDTGSVENIQLKKIGERRDANGGVAPPSVSDPADVVFWGYDTSEGDIAGRVYGMRAASTQQTLADAQELRVWRTDTGRSAGQSRLYEVRLNNGFGLSGGPASRLWLMDDAAATNPVTTVNELRRTGTPLDFTPTGSQTHVAGLTNFESEVAVDMPTATYLSNSSPSTDLVTGDFSWVCWVKPSMAGDHTILYLGDPSVSGRQIYKVVCNSTDTRFIAYGNDGGNTADTVINTDQAVSSTNYTMVAAVYDSTAGQAYVRVGIEGGILDNRFTQSISNPLESIGGSTVLALGADLQDPGPSNYLIGPMHTAAFFPFALTSDDEVKLFQAGAPTSEKYFSPLPMIMGKTNY